MTSKIPLMIFMAVAGLIVGLLLPKPFQDDDVAAEAVTTAPLSPTQELTPATQHDSITPEPQLSQLRDLMSQELRKESQARQQLEKKLGELSARVASLEKGQPKTSTDLSAQETTTTISTNTRQSINRPGWINVQALITAGVDVYQANKIRDTYENVEMQKLYLRDKAIREGWIGDDKYRQQVEQLDNQITSFRDQLNDKEYDAFLYATGRPNRVVIESTLSTSPAREAGIKAGDNIISYNNSRVYTWSDLRDATTKCQTDSSVEVVIERNGQRQPVYVPCGPLGVRLDNNSVQP